MSRISFSVLFLDNTFHLSQEYTHQGGKLPKCVLLCGPSSTDKTMLAKTIAGEAGVSFFQRNGSKFDERDKFDEENDGVGAQRVMDFFADAKKQSPCIIFIDDIDAVGGSRNHERQTLNQMLAELDILKQNEGILVIGATNFPELLDKALARPGRFDRHVVIDRSRRTLTNFGISCVKGILLLLWKNVFYLVSWLGWLKKILRHVRGAFTILILFELCLFLSVFCNLIVNIVEYGLL
jgi:hypothetical protein